MHINRNNDKQKFLDTIFSTDKSNQQFFNWIISRNCRYCGNEVSKEKCVVVSTYWKAFYAIACKSCAENGKGYREEAYLCQCIDADCNDCMYFKRIDGNIGECLKFNKSVIACPNFCSGYSCFVHRLDKDKKLCTV